MREILFALSTGFFAGIFVYSIIGWVFTRKISRGIKYKLLCLISLVALVVISLVR